MATQTDTEVYEAQIEQLLSDWEKAVRNKDIDAVMACYTPNVVAFDMIPPLQCDGAEAYRKNWQLGFEMCQGQGDFETRGLEITASPDVAFCHRLNRMSGTTTDGQDYDCWVRWTVCVRRVNGRWLIAHDHISVPIDMETNQGLMDMKP